MSHSTEGQGDNSTASQKVHCKKNITAISTTYSTLSSSATDLELLSEQTDDSNRSIQRQKRYFRTMIQTRMNSCQ